MKLHRVMKDKRLGGVCSGIAETMKWDVTVIRIVAFALLFTPVPIIIAYLAAWFILPLQGETNDRNSCCCASANCSCHPTKDNKEFLAG